MSDKEYGKLAQNRPNADVVFGPVCPSTVENVTPVQYSRMVWGSRWHLR